MKTNRLSVVLLSVLLISAVSIYAAEIAVPSSPSGTAKVKSPPPKPQETAAAGDKIVYHPPAEKALSIVYRPPIRGAPNVRVTGFSRSRSGGVENLIVLSALAPEHTGWTTQAQPSLFWYQSQSANAKFELTLLDGDKAKPILELKKDGSKVAGIQRVRLADYKIELKPDVEYQWIVAIVVDDDNRSKDIISSAGIKRVAPSEELLAKVKAADRERQAIIYANQGFWYDALQTLSEEIEAKPKDTSARELRSDLLKQVDLKQAAEFDAALIRGASSQAKADGSGKAP